MAHAQLIVNDAYVTSHGGASTTISGTFTCPNNTTPAIIISTSKPVTITNSYLRGASDLISALGANPINLTVTNTVGYGTNPNSNGASKGYFVNAGYVAKLVVQGCYLEGTAYGIKANQYNGTRNGDNTINISNNRMHNIDGRYSNGSGGYQTSGLGSPHAIQIQDVHGVPNALIAWNEIIGEPYNSYDTDVINFTRFSGTSGSHVNCTYNYIQGQYAPDPIHQGNAGVGILTDGAGGDSFSDSCAYIDITNNQVVNGSNCAFGIAEGHDNGLYWNRAISSGKVPGTTNTIQASNVGIYISPQSGQPQPPFGNNTAQNNTSSWINAGGADNSFFLNTGYVNSFNNGGIGHNATVADEANEYVTWQQRTKNSNIRIGSSFLPDGLYKITAKTSGDALDCYAYGSGNNTPIQLWPYSGSNNQKWWLHNLGNGYYSIRTYDPSMPGNIGRSLDATGCSGADGTVIQLYDYSGAGCQQWSITQTSGSFCSIATSNAKSDGSHDVLDGNGCTGADGTRISLWSWGGGSCQQEWNFTLVQ
ncbi:hypothetical protein CCAX7_45350 [Capsulimonas corticalis]|uniref:Ricin B lectin domain-containing protein n=1 Tax=Capsulimonas corticalis TaxID=2219043 RepID=A0A9N7QBS1_9BACT|nr:RICIN domain-containing protein [Capsulimonas corticalis]BDI32484.1 hypothetical protein CCAX7_45350 [Capsulimonas corticalis]